jgi:hypothetical protein
MCAGCRKVSLPWFFFYFFHPYKHITEATMPTNAATHFKPTKQAENKTSNKTKPTELSVEAFLNAVDDTQKREDSFAILDLMRRVTGVEPRMWGTSIVGFGTYHYKYESGREGDMPIVGFSPRKQNLTLYLTPYYEDSGDYDDLLARLGKYTTGKACLYIKTLTDVDASVLEQLVRESASRLNNR